ncbi:unnamed protein product [Prunus armeniaca]
MAKLKHPISCKALTKPPKDQKPPPFTGGFVPNKPTQNKVYSFDLTKVDALFDEMLLQKAIETPHRLPKPEELKGRQYCRWHKSWNHSTNSYVVFRDVIQEGITVGSKCKCESELEVTLGRQKQPTPSVFYRIGTSYQQNPVPVLSKDRTRQKDYLRLAQHNRRTTEQPKKETPIKRPGKYKCLSPSLAVYLVTARNLLTEFREATWEHIPREENCAVNELAQVATGIQMPEDYVQRSIKLGKKSLPSVLTRGMEIDVNSAIITEDDWRNPIIKYLQYPTLPSEKKVRIMALNYLMWNGDLVRNSKDEVLLRCLGKKEYMKVMGETHEGICGAHQGGRKMCC